MLLDLVDAGQAPHSLFDRPDPKDDRLIEAFDAINDRLGPGAIQFGRAGQAGAWRSSTAFRSPDYTTRWADIPVVKACGCARYAGGPSEPAFVGGGWSA